MTDDTKRNVRFANADVGVGLFMLVVLVFLSIPVAIERIRYCGDYSVLFVDAFALVLYVFKVLLGRRKPFVEITSNTLRLYSKGVMINEVPLTSIREVQHGFNKTVLIIEESLPIVLSHWQFSHAFAAQRFQAAIREAVEKTKSRETDE